MGLARRFERGGQDDGLTQSGMTLGTFDYISPEQARDPRDVDVRSDLYSLGCTLFHMLTGRPPFPGGTVLQKLLQHQEEPPPDIRALNPDVPPDLAAILAKLMAKDRDRRYQTPEQLVRDLLTVAGSLGLRSLSPEGLVWMTAASPSTWERHLFWGIPALALALVVAGLVWWGRSPRSRRSCPSRARCSSRRPRPRPRSPGDAAGPRPADAAEARTPSRRDIPAPAPPRRSRSRPVTTCGPAGRRAGRLHPGPGRRRPVRPGPRGGRPVAPPSPGRPDLTIKAGPGGPSRPAVGRPGRRARGGCGPAPLRRRPGDARGPDLGARSRRARAVLGRGPRRGDRPGHPPLLVPPPGDSPGRRDAWRPWTSARRPGTGDALPWSASMPAVRGGQVGVYARGPAEIRLPTAPSARRGRPSGSTTPRIAPSAPGSG
jgi:serine/threonine-protein kinase